jgi:imidazolonepropionase-like amidohydrolase
MMALYALRNLRIHLESGVTTLRDNGGRNRVTFVTREAVSRGYFESPKLLLSGRPITPSGGHFHWCNGVADGPDELRAAVRLLAAEGADHIKIMASGGSTSGNRPYWASYDADELRVIVETAHGLQRLTTAHCRAKQSIEYAIEAGLDCIEHADFLVPPGEGTSDRELYGGISAAVVPIGAVDYDPRLTAGLAERGIYVSFTFQAGGYDRLVELRAGESLTTAESHLKDRLERYYEIKLDVFRRLMHDGIGERLVVSSDAGPFIGRFGHLHYGLELAVEAGMSPTQAIDAATRIAAAACGVADDVGTLEPGKTADVLIVDGDPLADISRIAHPLAVYRAGSHVQRTH